MWRAVLELIFACQIWGFGFVATVWALESFSPLGMTSLRFILAVLLGLPLLISKKARKHFFSLSLLKTAFWPGVYLSLTIILQTWGLIYTTATKSGFLTTLYAVLVPLAESIFFKRKLHKSYSLWIILALFGTGLIVELSFEPLNLGDILTILCAFAATAHILSVGLAAKKPINSFWFNYFQSVWAGIIAIFTLPLFSGPHIKSLTFLSITGFLWLVVMSTMIAFAIQLRAQRHINATHASLIYLLESPFAFIFAVLLLDETLSPLQALGALFIFLSAIGATWTEGLILRKQKSNNAAPLSA